MSVMILSEESIDNILKCKSESADYEFLSCETIDDDILSFWGSPIKIIIRYKECGEEKDLNLFVKTIPKGEYRESATLRMGGFHKEPLLYNLLFVDLRKYFVCSKVFPDAYLAKPNKYLVMEDLSDIGFKTKSLYDPCDLEHCEALIIALAKLHVSSIKLEKDKGKSLLELVPYLVYETMISSEKGHPGHNYLNASINVIHKLCEKYIEDYTPLLREKADEFLRTIPERLHQYKEFPNVLTHGNLWGNKIMFKYNEEGIVDEAVIFDFQMARYSIPSQDLLFFLHTTTLKSFRDQHYKYCLKFYYNHFVKNLKKFNLDPNILKWDEFLFMTNEIRPTILALAPIYQQFCLIPEHTLESIMKSEDDYKVIYELDRMLTVLREYSQNAQYRQRLLESIEEFLEEIRATI